MSVPKPDCRVRARERINRIPPSAERNGRGLSSGFDTGHQDDPVPESTSGMPSLPDLLDELETDAVDLNALEQLTQTLLEDIARDLESAAQKSTDQEPAACPETNPGKMVGPTSKQLESSRSEGLEEPKEITAVEQDISEYLLLHHNYAKIRPREITPAKTSHPSTARKSIHKSVKPKSKRSTPPAVIVQPVPDLSLQLETSQNDVMYGTFDKNTNTITILVDNVPMNEVVLENTETPALDSTSCLTAPESSSEGGLSPRSDLGYESLDSPAHISDFDSWDSSVTELFPSLF